MPCLLLVLALSFPRVVLLLMWFFTHMLDRAYSGILIPLIGFLFMPVTTIAYAWVVSTHRAIDGFNLIVIIIAVLIDLGSNGGGARYQSRRS